jgi:hypothetical protein
VIHIELDIKELGRRRAQARQMQLEATQATIADLHPREVAVIDQGPVAQTVDLGWATVDLRIQPTGHRMKFSSSQAPCRRGRPMCALADGGTSDPWAPRGPAVTSAVARARKPSVTRRYGPSKNRCHGPAMTDSLNLALKF